MEQHQDQNSEPCCGCENAQPTVTGQAHLSAYAEVSVTISSGQGKGNTERVKFEGKSVVWNLGLCSSCAEDIVLKVRLALSKNSDHVAYMIVCAGVMVLVLFDLPGPQPLVRNLRALFGALAVLGFAGSIIGWIKHKIYWRKRRDLSASELLEEPVRRAEALRYAGAQILIKLVHQQSAPPANRPLPQPPDRSEARMNAVLLRDRQITAQSTYCDGYAITRVKLPDNSEFSFEVAPVCRERVPFVPPAA